MFLRPTQMDNNCRPSNGPIHFTCKKNPTYFDNFYAAFGVISKYHVNIIVEVSAECM